MGDVKNMEDVRAWMDEAVQMIAKINALPRKSDKKSLNTRVEMLLLAMSYLEKGFSEFLNYKESK